MLISSVKPFRIMVRGSSEAEERSLLKKGKLEAGNLVLIPPDMVHGIENPSGEVLTYVSAATPQSIRKRSTTRARCRPRIYRKRA